MHDLMMRGADALQTWVDISLVSSFAEAMAKAQLSNKGSGKGKALRVPQMGDADGPVWVERGRAFGYKLVIGNLPRDITRPGIGQFCAGEEEVEVEPQWNSDLSFAVLTFTDAALGIKAFEAVSMTKFDLGARELHWCPLVQKRQESAS